MGKIKGLEIHKLCDSRTNLIFIHPEFFYNFLTGKRKELLTEPVIFG